jgi:hypothetical protein
LFAEVLGFIDFVEAFHLATEVDGFAGEIVFVGSFRRTVFAGREYRVDDS